MDDVNANESVSNGQRFTANLEQRQHAEEQCIFYKPFLVTAR